MKKCMVAALLITTTILAGCATQTPQTAQPYKGLEIRKIKAMDPKKIDDLLHGRGAGYALSAELNQYPGPLHALELAAKLKLTPEQETKIKAVQAKMKQDATALGTQMVDLEEKLEQRFASGQITAQELNDLTAQIATVEGKLRAVHLGAHLELKVLLTPEQIATYDKERGYTSGQGHNKHGHGH